MAACDSSNHKHPGLLAQTILSLESSTEYSVNTVFLAIRLPRKREYWPDTLRSPSSLSTRNTQERTKPHHQVFEIVGRPDIGSSPGRAASARLSQRIRRLLV